MMSHDTGLEIAACCDGSGIITEVLRNEFRLKSCLSIGRSFLNVAHSGSRGKLVSFIRRIAERGAALDWELTVCMGGGLLPLFFSGCKIAGGILIVGSTKSRSVRELRGELMRIHREKAEERLSGRSDQLPSIKANAGRSLREELGELSSALEHTKEELLNKTLDLERQKVETFQELGMAVHGLRNPVSGILSAAEYLIEDATESLNETQTKMLESIGKSSVFMLQIIEDILNISAMECGKLKMDLVSADLVSLVREAVSLNEPEAAQKGVRLAMFSTESEVIVELDSVKITQVIDNLLSNAIKFSQRGSRIEIRVGIKGNAAFTSVRDEGAGIPEDRLETIFEPFHTHGNGNERQKPGTGLGLAISRRIVESHAGTIDVESEYGRGSTFIVTLPILRKAQKNSAVGLRKPPGTVVQPEHRFAAGA